MRQDLRMESQQCLLQLSTLLPSSTWNGNILLLWVRICLDTECLGIALHCLQKEGKVTLLVSVYSVFRKRTSGLFPPTVIGQAIAGY